MAQAPSFVSELALGDDQVSVGESARDNHAGDFGTPSSGEVRPDVVVFPESTADVVAVVETAAAHGIPVTPYAAGTGLSHGATPVHGGISLDTTRMDEILEVRPDDLQVDVQPGVLGGDLNEALSAYGLVVPSMPTSGDLSTIGGMLSTDASGMKTVKYGKVSDWLLELEVVLADGSVIDVGSKAIKSSSGYNLRELFVGAEGTFGIITRATMQLAGLPEQTRAGRGIFDSLDDATAAVHDVVRSGVDIATIELVDSGSATIANAYSETGLPDTPMVFLEFHANHGIEEEIDFCRAILEAHDVREFEIASDDEAMADLWEARHDLAYAVGDYDENLIPIGPEDLVVPISKYPNLIREAKGLADDAGFLSYWFGHAGDGNVHGGMLVPRDDEAAIETAREISDTLTRRTIDMGGTVTGEHGIGQHEKRDYLVDEHGPVAVELMAALKRTLDPQNILNPGKIIPPDAETDTGRFG